MLRLKYILFLLLLFSSIKITVAQKPNPAVVKPKPNSISAVKAPTAKPATVTPAKVPAAKPPVDSLFLKFDGAKKYVLHKVKPGETLFSLAKAYGSTVVNIQMVNDMGDKGIQPGMIMQIPVPNKAIVRYGRFAKKDYPPLYYRVKEKETLYNVAKRQFEMPVDSVKKINKLKSDALTLNQVLQVGWLCRPCLTDTAGGGSVFGSPAAIAYHEFKTRYEKERESKIEKLREGSAYFKKYDRLSGDNSLFCLFNDVPAGSIVLIENPATNRKVFAKVISTVPQTENTANAIVVVSPAVAKALGALDPRFWVKVKFLE